MEYFLSTILSAYRELESHLVRISKIHGSKTDMVINAIDSFVQDFSLADLERACPTVGWDWIRKLLQRLTAEGKVQAPGKGRYSKWRRIQ